MHTDLLTICLPQETQGQGWRILRAHYTTTHTALLTEIPELLGPLVYLPLEDLSFTPTPCWTQGNVRFLLWKYSRASALGLFSPSGSSVPQDTAWGTWTIFKGSAVPNVLVSPPSGPEGLSHVGQGGHSRHWSGAPSDLFSLALVSPLENQKPGILLIFSVVCDVIFFLRQPMLLVQFEISERLQGNLGKITLNFSKISSAPFVWKVGQIWREWN